MRLSNEALPRGFRRPVCQRKQQVGNDMNGPSLSLQASLSTRGSLCLSRAPRTAPSGVNPRTVEAQVLGEHGTSSVFLWSHATVAGIPALRALEQTGQRADGLRSGIEKEVREANIAIIEGTGASQLGIGMVCARLAEIIGRDERTVIPVGIFHPEHGVTLSLPSVLGRAGVTRVLRPEMSEEEQQGLRKSAEQIRNAMERTRS